MMSRLLLILIVFISCKQTHLPGATNQEVRDWYDNNKDTDKIAEYVFINRSTGDTVEVIGKTHSGIPITAVFDSLRRTAIAIGIEFNEKEIMAVPILKTKQ
jgi:hypothetical protein